MSTTGFFPIGSKLERKNPSSGTFEEVTQCTLMGLGSITTDKDEITSMNSTGGVKEKMALLKDPGAIPCELVFNPDNTMHRQLFADNLAGTLLTWRVRLPNAGVSTETFDAFVEGLDAPIELTRGMRLKFNLERSGLPVFVW